MPRTRRAARHSLACGIVALAAAAMLAGCVPEPSPSTTSAASPPASRSTAPSAAAPSPTASATAAGADITLPAACERLYSPAMLATLQQQTPPLNDPGVTMYSSQQVRALEVLNSGAPTRRCTWGKPSTSGLSTNVTIVDPAAAASVVDALRTAGFSCTDHRSGTLCSFQQDSLTQDDTIVHRGETQFFRGNGWVTTAWITVDPSGYTDDIITALWG